MTLQEILEEGVGQLRGAGIVDAELDAWYLLEHICSIDRVFYLLNRYVPLQREDMEEKYGLYMKSIQERVSHKPLQHIIGTQEFMGLPFAVSEHVLIPRQDTETLVEEVLKSHSNSDIEVLDMCTGSACIAICLKKLGSYKEVYASDYSEQAIRVAVKNADSLDCEINFLTGDLFESCKGKKFDIIVSNPPYIPTLDILSLMTEVKDYDPLSALDGGEDGLVFYRRLTNESVDYLKSGGFLYLEIGYDQGEAVSRLLEQHQYKNIEIIKDMAGQNRVIKAVSPF